MLKLIIIMRKIGKVVKIKKQSKKRINENIITNIVKSLSVFQPFTLHVERWSKDVTYARNTETRCNLSCYIHLGIFWSGHTVPD